MAAHQTLWPQARRLACPVLLAAALFAAAAGAEPVSTIRKNGPAANRVDIVILGDGYTSSEIDKYKADVTNMLDDFFAQQPFKDYRRYFNVHRINVTSNQSGADHPEIDSYVDTALDASYNCGGIQRLLCVDTSKVYAVVDRSVPANKRDIILVLVNDGEWGGAGGAIAVASTHPDVVELVLHELGHSFGLLADEYESSPPACNNSIEPAQVNVTLETRRSKIKWNTGGGPPKGWIRKSTNLPTGGATDGVPGLYEGGKYCATGVYRPTSGSKMRFTGQPFEQINEEQLVKRIYNFVSPIDSVSPNGAGVVMAPGEKRTFRVRAPRPASHKLTIVWRLNGRKVKTGPSYTLAASSLKPGNNRLQATVADKTAKVRHDPNGALRQAFTWRISDLTGFLTLMNWYLAED